MVENNRSSLVHEIGAFKLQSFWVNTRKRRQWASVIRDGLQRTAILNQKGGEEALENALAKARTEAGVATPAAPALAPGAATDAANVSSSAD